MARKRKTVTLSLDPDLVERLRAWCNSRAIPIPMTRAMDAAMAEFLDAQSGAATKDQKEGQDNG